MGGGGANSLNSPETGDNSDFEGTDEDPKKEDDIVTWTEPTYKTYDDYFTDYDISAETITESDLTGKGTEADPYIVRSTRGFLWLSSYEKSGLSLYTRYVKLATNIILNDEKFDEDGTPSGGDGVVYQWKPITSGVGFSFDGCGRYVCGMYINDTTKTQAALFGEIQIGDVLNLNFKDVFVQAKKKVSALCFISRGIVKNCNVFSGYLFGESYVSGLISDYGMKIENCKNYAQVKVTSSNASGIATSVGSNGKYFACENYGKIIMYAWGGGIMSSTFGGTKIIEKCSNYGEIISQDARAGGIIGAYVASSGKLCIKDCKNYGSVFGEKAYNGIGGILGLGYGYVFVYNCENYADLFGKEITGGIVSNISVGTDNVKEGRVEIYNCYNSSNSPFLGNVNMVSKGNVLIVEVKGAKIEYKEQQKGAFVYSIREKDGGKVNLYLENSEINLLAKESFKGSAIAWFLSCDIFIDNVLINVKQTNKEFKEILINTQEVKYLHLQNLIVNGTTYKQYFGTDFSGFYCDWKTGEIGLKALNGKGFFQASLSEEILRNKGFEKKTV